MINWFKKVWKWLFGGAVEEEYVVSEILATFFSQMAPNGYVIFNGQSDLSFHSDWTSKLYEALKERGSYRLLALLLARKMPAVYMSYELSERCYEDNEKKLIYRARFSVFGTGNGAELGDAQELAQILKELNMIQFRELVEVENEIPLNFIFWEDFHKVFSWRVIRRTHYVDVRD